MKTTGVSDIPKFGLLDFLGHPIAHGRDGTGRDGTNQPKVVQEVLADLKSSFRATPIVSDSIGTS